MSKKSALTAIFLEGCKGMQKGKKSKMFGVYFVFTSGQKHICKIFHQFLQG